MIRGVLIGAGGFGAAWVNFFLPQFRDRIEIVAISDIDPHVLKRAGEVLSVPEVCLFANYTEMLATVAAEVCFIVIRPEFRTEAVRAVAERGLAVLCEKPMAASWQQTLDIGNIVTESGIKYAVMQNYREQSRIHALKHVLQRNDLKPINLIECRFGINFSIDNAGGAFRHQIPDAFIYEGSEHHFDQLRNLTGADAEWVSGVQWGQEWSTFGSPTCCSLHIRMTNGVMVSYEMNNVERGTQNGWHEEFYRISTAGGTVTLDNDHIIRIVRDTETGRTIEEIVPETLDREEHIVIISSFLDWIDGGDPPFSIFEDNVRTMALTFAAVESTHTGTRINARDMLETAFPAIADATGQEPHASYP
ncbi:MAG: Gfo/Idh/MocA family oxidoreductase [Thermomicrobiales bacterium]